MRWDTGGGCLSIILLILAILYGGVWTASCLVDRCPCLTDECVNAIN